MELIGLSGYARSGKDEAAKVLVEEFGFTRVAFADKLREFLYALDPDVLCEYDGQGKPHLGVSTVRKIIDNVGWDGYKETQWKDPIRKLLQRLGTEAGRQTLWDSIWIDAALTGFDDNAKIVVTDCRFPNEAQAIKDRGGIVVRVSRKGVGPANAHASETSLDDWDFDYALHNDYSLEVYRDHVRGFVDHLGTEKYFDNVLGM